jgi:hypothetical protein
MFNSIRPTDLCRQSAIRRGDRRESARSGNSASNTKGQRSFPSECVWIGKQVKVIALQQLSSISVSGLSAVDLPIFSRP